VAVGLVDALKDVVTKEGSEAGVNFIKTLATGKGLGNEAEYGIILDRLNLNTEERNLLIKAIEELRAGTEEQKQAANNFVIAVALGKPNEKTGERPGEMIINGFIHRISEYPNEMAKVKMLKENILHIGTDAETKKKITDIQKLVEVAWEKIGDFLENSGDDIIKASRKFDKMSKKKLDDFEKRQLWKKIMMN
jgi:hypothetical protein